MSCVRHSSWYRDLYESEASLNYTVTGKIRIMLVLGEGGGLAGLGLSPGRYKDRQVKG